MTAATPGKRTAKATKKAPAKRAAASAATSGKTAAARAGARTRKQAATRQPAAAPAPVRKRTGRRPGVSGSRQAIIESARAKFAELGYEGATIRAIAQQAGVDAALIHHFFQTKEGVFAAAMRDALQADDLLPAVVEPGIDGLGERLVRMFLGLWDKPPARDMLAAVVRSAASHDEAADLLRDVVSTELLGRVVRATDRPQPDVRAALVGSQLVGLAFMRHIVAIEPLASMPKERLIQSVAPAIQHYLADDLPGTPKPRKRSSRKA